jgi:hypothetical protein
MSAGDELRHRRAWFVPVLSLVIVAAGALALLAMGHTWICPCGSVKIWGPHGAMGENSQHLFDWYSPSHIIHGVLFYAAAWLLFRRARQGTRFLIALFVEVAWEVIENTPFLMDRYRGATVSLDYFGDSVVNSLADVAMMMVGYVLAVRLPVWASVVLIVALDVAAGLAIRDNLVLNVLMLVWPIEAIKAWQSGA